MGKLEVPMQCEPEPTSVFPFVFRYGLGQTIDGAPALSGPVGGDHRLRERDVAPSLGGAEAAAIPAGTTLEEDLHQTG